MSTMSKHDPLTYFARIRRMAGKAQILAGTEIPPLALEAFYEQMFPARANFLKRNWQWLYRTGESATIKSPIVVMAGEQVAGHVSVIPLTLRRRQDERAAVWICDIAVLPKHSGKALGPALLAEAMALSPLCIGFPNEASWKIISRLGWQAQLHTVGLSLLLHPNRHPTIRERATGTQTVAALARLAGTATRIVWRARTLTHNKLLVSPVTADQLVSFCENESSAALHSARTQGFWRWRITAHPNVEEHFVLRLPHHLKVQCSAVARIVEEDGFRRLHLLSLRAELPGLADFLAGVVRWALEQDVHVVSMVSSDPAVTQVARRWLPILKQLHYAYHADDPAGEEFLRAAGHNWEYIDGDFDLTYSSSSLDETHRSLKCA